MGLRAGPGLEVQRRGYGWPPSPTVVIHNPGSDSIPPRSAASRASARDGRPDRKRVAAQHEDGTEPIQIAFEFERPHPPAPWPGLSMTPEPIRPGQERVLLPVIEAPRTTGTSIQGAGAAGLVDGEDGRDGRESIRLES